MRTDLQLIQSAIADFDNSITALKLNYSRTTDHFNYYPVQLPDKFKGLPSTWYFAIHKTEKQTNSSKESVTEARKLIQQAIKAEELPLVIIYDNSEINLTGVVQFPDEAVFFIVTDTLPAKHFWAHEMRSTPIIVAIKNKFTDSQAPFLLSPYTPNKPVIDWRFFGRKKEIKDLVESQSNYFVVGARRIGKTSLLKETKRLLEKNHDVYLIPVQEATTLHDVIALIAKSISPKYSYKAIQNAKEIDLNYLSAILKKLKGDRKKITLIFDELGNVLQHNRQDDWKFIGTLRELSQNNDIRIIISAFQEIFIKQHENFSSPYINFGTIMKVNVFSNAEIDEIITDPLSVWIDIPDKKELNKLIRRYFGRHPLILQYLGLYLFQNVLLNKKKSITMLITDVINGYGLNSFQRAIDDTFTYNKSYIERYLFLKICISASEKNSGIDLTTINITQSSVNDLLKDININSTYDERIFLLDRMCMKGLFYQDDTNFSLYHIGSPLIFYYMKMFFNPLEQLCSDYCKEIDTLELSLI